MSVLAQQPELHISEGDNLTGTLDTREFDRVGILDCKYYVDTAKEFYFIVRKDTWSDDKDMERVCLYRENVINELAYGDRVPHTQWVSNELRYHRSIEQIHRDMTVKANDIIYRATTKIMQNGR